MPSTVILVKFKFYDIYNKSNNMKKIRLTESQLLYIKKIINESDKSDYKKRFLSDIKSDFMRSINSAKPGDNLFIATGDINEDDSDYFWKYLNYYSFLVVNKGDDGTLLIEFLSSDADVSELKGQIYEINGNHSLQFNNGEPYIGLFQETEKGYKKIKLPKFVMFDIVEDMVDLKRDDMKKGVQRIFKKEQDKQKEIKRQKKVQEIEGKEKANLEKFKKDAEEKWFKGKDTIMKSMVFEPGFLGMNNFFFFPKGYIAMDDILKKYGLGVHNNSQPDDGTDDSKIQFKLLGDDIKIPGTSEVLLAKKVGKDGYIGELDKEERVINYSNNGINLHLKIDGTNEITSGVKYDVKVYKDNNNNDFITRSKIQLL